MKCTHWRLQVGGEWIRIHLSLLLAFINIFQFSLRVFLNIWLLRKFFLIAFYLPGSRWLPWNQGKPSMAQLHPPGHLYLLLRKQCAALILLTWVLWFLHSMLSSARRLFHATSAISLSLCPPIMLSSGNHREAPLQHLILYFSMEEFTPFLIPIQSGQQGDENSPPSLNILRKIEHEIPAISLSITSRVT